MYNDKAKQDVIQAKSPAVRQYNNLRKVSMGQFLHNHKKELANLPFTLVRDGEAIADVIQASEASRQLYKLDTK